MSTKYDPNTDGSNSDYDEYIIHEEGNEQFCITGKTRKQLKKHPLTAQKMYSKKQYFMHSETFQKETPAGNQEGSSYSSKEVVSENKFRTNRKRKSIVANKPFD